MPNMKIYVHAHCNGEAAVHNVLHPLRSMLSREPDVGVAACQLVVLKVLDLKISRRSMPQSSFCRGPTARATGSLRSAH